MKKKELSNHAWPGFEPGTSRLWGWRSTDWAIGTEKKFGQKIDVYQAIVSSKMKLNLKILLSKKFSDHFFENFCFIIIDFCHIFFLVNFFLSALLQPLYLVTKKFFFQNQYMDSTIGSKMTLVNIVPQVVLHQIMHLLVTVNFLGESNRLPAHSVWSVVFSHNFVFKHCKNVMNLSIMNVLSLYLTCQE